MKRATHWSAFGGASALREPICTVGVFDGVHRGHREVFYELRAWADAIGGETCVLTFSRHPLEVLRGVPLPLLMSNEQRLNEFSRHGMDAALVLEFGLVKDLSPEEFLTTVIRDGLGCRRLLLGFDSHIGKDRAGDSTTLPALGASLGIEVRVASRVLDQAGQKVGSSVIRKAIASGNLESASAMLGHPVTVLGKVQHGAGRGAEVGVATANLAVDELALPPNGVYLVRVFRGGETAPAIANLGIRPTFGDGGPRVLEVHIPGWNMDLYGETLEVRLIRFLRPEIRFESTDELRAQIQADLAEFRQATESGEL